MSSIDWTRWNTVTKKQIPFKDISFIPNNVGLHLQLTEPCYLEFFIRIGSKKLHFLRLRRFKLTQPALKCFLNHFNFLRLNYELE